MCRSCPQACITPTVAPRSSVRANLRCVGQAGFLGDGQRVEIGANHERLAGAVLQDTHDAMPADAGRHFEARRP